MSPVDVVMGVAVKTEGTVVGGTAVAGMAVG